MGDLFIDPFQRITGVAIEQLGDWYFRDTMNATNAQVWDPDNNRMLFWTTGSMFEYDGVTFNTTPIGSGAPAVVNQAAWHAGRSEIHTQVASATIHVWDGSWLRERTENVATINGVAYRAQDDTTYYLRRNSGGKVEIYSFVPSGVLDGATVAYVDDGPEAGTLNAGNWRITGDGRGFASVSIGGGLFEIWRYSFGVGEWNKGTQISTAHNDRCHSDGAVIWNQIGLGGPTIATQTGASFSTIEDGTTVPAAVSTKMIFAPDHGEIWRRTVVGPNHQLWALPIPARFQ